MPTLKRAFDIAASCAGVAVALPMVVSVAAAMAVDTRSLPIFRQVRVGRDGKPFTMYKIKTMKDIFDRQGKPLPENQRTSRLGVLVRKSRMDELVQLVHVLKGEMSLVGPRPLPFAESISANPLRQTVAPGLTGLTQVSGNNNLSVEEVLGHDLSYIRRMQAHGPVNNLLYDLAILAATPLALVINRHAPHYRK